jgi:outer membrane protein assembly factor BamD (BamD/ComL family)
MRSRWFVRWLGLGAATLGAACVTQPMALGEAEQRLTTVEQHVQQADWDPAGAGLETLADDRCPKRLRDRRDLALARLRLGRDDPWAAFTAIERFADLYPHSELRPAVVETIWACGKRLVERDSGFLFFWSDATGARTVLEHLVTRHPESPRMADALRLLGDMAFADDDHPLAQQRYRDLMLHRPDSEWAGYAQYRYAMSLVAMLEGPDYDLDGMTRAVRELRDFLRSKPEDPEVLRNVEAALARVLGWQAERHLRIAGFYRTIGNQPGELHHLERAAADEFAGTPTHAEAVAARDALRSQSASGTDRP